MTSTNTYPVVLYGRVSQSRDEHSKSVDDQLADLRSWAAREGWEVIAEFRDDGISASRYANGKTRPGWQDAMDLIMSGEVKALLVWDFARATRDDKVTAALKAACIERGVKLGYGGMLRDPSTADGGFYVGLDGLMAAKHSAELSEKMQRAVNSRAADGRPHGSLPYGYRRVIDPNTGRTIGREEDPEQGPIVREIVRRLLAREPAHAIAADLNRRQVPTGTGKQWRGGNLSKLAVRPAYAALRTHQGRVLSDVKATWPALVSEADHLALKAMFADPARDKFRNSTVVKHLGTGIFRCGREGCDGVMRVVVDPKRGPRYDCRTCHGVSRRQPPVDEAVEALMIARLSRPDALAAFADGDDEDVKAAAAEVARLQGKLAEARQAWEDDELTLAEYKDMRARLQPKIEAAQKRARPKHVPAVVLDLAGPDAARRWKAASVKDKRVVLGALAEVTILPVGSGAPVVGQPVPFDPSTSLRITWK